MEFGDAIEAGVGDQGSDGATDGGVDPRVSVENGDLDSRQIRVAGGTSVDERGRCEGESESLEHFEDCRCLNLFDFR